MKLAVVNNFHDPATWCREFNRGNKAALRHLFMGFGEELTYLTNKIVRDLPTAEEITDDVFLKLWQLPDKEFITPGEVRAWLVLVAKRTALNHLKIKQRGEIKHQLYLVSQDEMDEDNLAITHENNLIKAILFKEILSALDELGEQQQTVILLSLDGLNTAQIAKAMNLRQQTVRNYQGKAILNLRKRLSNVAFLLMTVFLAQGIIL
jgi:RNA polymerase sigma factor (sigma-70 family)